MTRDPRIDPRPGDVVCWTILRPHRRLRPKRVRLTSKENNGRQSNIEPTLLFSRWFAYKRFQVQLLAVALMRNYEELKAEFDLRGEENDT